MSGHSEPGDLDSSYGSRRVRCHCSSALEAHPSLPASLTPEDPGPSKLDRSGAHDNTPPRTLTLTESLEASLEYSPERDYTAHRPHTDSA